MRTHRINHSAKIYGLTVKLTLEIIIQTMFYGLDKWLLADTFEFQNFHATTIK